MTTDVDALIAEARTDISDARRCESLHITPATGTILRALVKVTDALESTLAELRQERERADEAVERSPDQIEVDVCVKCGAVVFDPFQHDAWHRAAEGTGKPTNHEIRRQP